MIRSLRTSITYLALMTFLLGVLYPAFVWLGGHLVFPRQAEGSLVLEKQRLMGSALIGQAFTKDIYFWGRPSATRPFPYNAQESRASHLNPANPLLMKRIEADHRKLKASLSPQEPVPLDLVTTSASGLDPHISPQAAQFQIPRIAMARRLDEKIIKQIVEEMTEPSTFGFLGEPRVNVLLLNLRLDRL